MYGIRVKLQHQPPVLPKVSRPIPVLLAEQLKQKLLQQLVMEQQRSEIKKMQLRHPKVIQEIRTVQSVIRRLVLAIRLQNSHHKQQLLER